MSPQPITTNPNKNKTLRDLMLDPSISGQPTTPQGMIPPSQDMNYGVEMKAQPGFLDKVNSFFRGSDPLDPSMGAMELAGAIPPVAGLALNQKNLPILEKAIKSKLPKASDDLLGKVDALVSSKYPSLRGLIDKVELEPSLLGTPTRGRYIRDEAGKKAILRPDLSPSQMVKSFVHELVHAYQDRHGRGFPGYITYKENPELYRTQRYERTANQGGQTGLDTFTKWSNMMKAAQSAPAAPIPAPQVLPGTVNTAKKVIR